MKPGVSLPALALFFCLAPAARAQCPNGAPPPCPVATAPRNVPLDARTWLILPFENTTRLADAQLIRQAGLNLLYQELSQWQDVRVVSDDRVDDLLLSLPENQRSPIGLDAARSLARRVGAAHVVLGDYIAVGQQAQVAAKVYDTRSGTQVRLVREMLVGFGGASALDSLSATFSRLGAKIMGLPPRSGQPLIAGTSSMEAFRAFLEGQAAFNRLDFPTARAHYTRALTHDSTFSAAQLQMYVTAADDGAARVHLNAALRHGTRLSTVQRARLDLAAMLDSANARACEPAARLLGLDSLDALGWIGIFRCELRFRPFRPFPGDTNKRLTAGSYHRARVAARRAMELEPTSVLALSHLANALQSNNQAPVCERAAAPAPCPLDSLWAGAVIERGDSVQMVLERWSIARGDPPYLRPEAWRQRRNSYIELRRAVETFLQHYPNNPLGVTFMAVARAELGDMAGAIAIADSAPAYLEHLRFLGPVTRFSILTAGEKADFTKAAAAFYGDSNNTTQGQVYGMLGRYREDAERGTAARRQVLGPWLPITAGVLPDNFDAIEAALLAAQPSEIARTNTRETSTLLSFRMRGRAPAADTAAAHPIRRVHAWLALGDTARARTNLARFDSTLARREPGTWDDGGFMFAAEAHAAMGDTARALATMLDWQRRWPTTMKHAAHRILDANNYNSMLRLHGRQWMLLGDLAFARGRQVEAGQAYDMVVRLWSGGDDIVQPLVQRARSRLVSP